MNESLEKLTEALQELEKQKKDKKPNEMPKKLSINDLVFSAGVSKFLEERRKYQERTRNVYCGQY